MLPQLILNRKFVEDFMASTCPCFAMGVVEEKGKECAFLALRPVEEIPNDVTYGGFNLGHSILGTSKYEIVHFAFEFYGYRVFNALVNPSNKNAKKVLTMMIEQKEFFFFALNPTGTVIAFKAEVGDAAISGIVSKFDQIKKSTTTEDQYEKTLVQFSDNPIPNGPMLHWVCRNDEGYLDLSGEIIELNPS